MKAQQNQTHDNGEKEYQWSEMKKWIATRMNWVEKSKSFLQLNQNQKMAYARRPGSRPLFNGFSMAMRLMWYQPDILQSGEEWVEILLKAEMHIKDN